MCRNKQVNVFSGILFVSMGRALLPYLARQASLDDPTYRVFKKTLHLYLWSIALGTLLLSLGVLLVASPLVQALFQRGAFSAAAAQNTSVILRGFLVGLTPMAVTFLLVRAFNALGETRIPLGVACVSVVANALSDALFGHFWQVQGIALATSLVYLISSVLLLALLHRCIGNLQMYRPPDAFLAFLGGQRHGRNTLPKSIGISRGSLRPPGAGGIARQKPGTGETAWRRTGLSGMAIAETRPGSFLTDGVWHQRVFGVAATVVALTTGAVASAHNALLTLRVTAGMLIVLCLLRYPYLLLLALASVNLGIGSSLALSNGNNLDMVLFLPLLLWLVALPWRQVARRVPGLIWQGLYLAWVLAGVQLSPLTSSAFLTLWLIMLTYPSVSALSVALLTTRRRMLGLIDVLLVTALLAALYGLYGFFTHQRGEMDPATHVFRITSLFTQATTFAFYLSLMIPLALYRCWFSRGAWRLFSALLMLCLLVALLLTFTRGAYAGVFVGMLLMALCVPSRQVRILVIAGLGALSALSVLLSLNGQLPFLARFFNGDLTTLNGRVYLWQALLSRFQVTQWLGNGLRAADSVLGYLRVGNHGQGVIGSAPHNLYLGTLYDHGVIGLFLLVGVFFSVGYSLLRGVSRSGGEQRMLYAVALAALASVLLQSCISRDLWIQQVGIPFWMIATLPSALCWSPTEVRVGGTQTKEGRFEAGRKKYLDQTRIAQKFQ